MAIVKCKSISAGRRFAVKVVNQELHKGTPYTSLLEKKSKSGGRNNNGCTTTRHIGGSYKRHYCLVGFRYNKDGIPATVERVEYDPNRTAHIVLLEYVNSKRRYIVAPKDVATGDQLIFGIGAPIKAGNSMPLRNIPVDGTVHGIELKPGKGIQIVRSAGTSVQLVAREGVYVTLCLCSGKIYKVLAECRVTLGEVSNSEYNLCSPGKAGVTRWRGVRPTVRGVVMNPVDYPHGGGEGCTSAGRHPILSWGLQTKGKKTRSNKRTDNVIVRRRK